MRRGRLLVAALGAAILGAATASAPAAEENSTEGLVSLESAGDGATLVVTGWLSPEKFELKNVRIAGSRLAGRGSDPDQFRAVMIDTGGRVIDTVSMWSPLLTFFWDMEGLKESAQNRDSGTVDILIPVSMTLNEVILAWPETKTEVARIKVGDLVTSFCKEMPDNPACRRASRPKG